MAYSPADVLGMLRESGTDSGDHLIPFQCIARTTSGVEIRYEASDGFPVGLKSWDDGDVIPASFRTVRANGMLSKAGATSDGYVSSCLATPLALLKSNKRPNGPSLSVRNNPVDCCLFLCMGLFERYENAGSLPPGIAHEHLRPYTHLGQKSGIPLHISRRESRTLFFLLPVQVTDQGH